METIAMGMILAIILPIFIALGGAILIGMVSERTRYTTSKKYKNEDKHRRPLSNINNRRF